MEQFAWFLWRRWSGHVEAYAVALATVTCVVVVAWPAAVTAALFLDLSVWEALIYVGVTTAIVAVLVPVTVAYFGRQFFSSARAWVEGDQSNPAEMHRLSLQATRYMSTRVALVQTPPQILLTGVLGARFAHLSPVGYLVLCLCFAGVLTLAAVISAEGLDLLFLPVRVEAATAMGGGQRSGVRGGRLYQRLLTMTLVLGWATAMVTAAISGRFATAESRFIAAFGAATISVTFFTVGVFQVFGLHPILRPVEELTEQTERVARGDLSERLPVTSDDEIGMLVASFNDMVGGLEQRERLQAAFGSYVDPALTKRLLAQGDDVFDGEELAVTVFFADIRDFTGYAEHAAAPEVVARLNSLWAIIVPILRQYGGHANKFLGDGLLAVFGAPEPVKDHADCAVAAAMDIQRQVRAQFDSSTRIGIGINSGTVVAGTVGGGGKLEFTLIGDPVNVAARVEQLTKDTNDQILLTQSTLDALAKRPPGLIPRGSYGLRGRSETVDLYALDPTHVPASGIS